MRKQLTILSFLFLLPVPGIYANQGGNDDFGYMWTDSKGTETTTDYKWIDIKASDNRIFSPGFDNSYQGYELPFLFEFYGTKYDSIYISTNGWVSFTEPGSSLPSNDTIPSASNPDAMIAVFWDDLVSTTGEGGGIFFDSIGTAPNRKVIINWDVNTNFVTPYILNCELILFEHSNLIKMQYNRVDSEYNNGGSATVGIQGAADDGITYQYYTSGTGVIQQYMAILFHNKFVGSTVKADIEPQSALAGSSTGFTYRLFEIDTAGTDGLGKVDRFAIKNPFSPTAATVTQIMINDYSAYIQNSSNKPEDPGYATWQNVSDSLIIRTSNFDVIDSLKVEFIQNMPTSLSTGNAYPGTYDAVLDSSATESTTNAGWTVDVVGDKVAYYEFSPSADQTTTAGVSVDFQVTARDEYGNAVVNSDTVALSTPGSESAQFSTNDTLVFNNASTINFSVLDNVTGSFTVSVKKINTTGVNGESGLITVNPANADNITILNSQSTITVGSERLLQAALEDQYGNRLADSTVNFTRIQGSGIFNDNSSATIDKTTGSNGVAEALYTASESISFVNDSIRVTFSGVADTIVLPLQAAQVSYYTFTPSGDLSVSAGEVTNFILTARDQYGNGVTNNGTVSLNAKGSTSAQFSAGPYSFSGDSVLSFTLSDTVAGDYTIEAVNQSNPEIRGESGLITVQALSGDHFTILSSQNAITVGTERLLQAALEDRYSNRIAGSTVTFTRIHGSGLFSDNDLATIDKTSGSNGVAEALYTASENINFVNDTIRVTSGGIADTIVLPLSAAPVSYYTFTPPGDLTVDAGEVTNFTLTARDQYGNGVINDGIVSLNAKGSSSAQFSAGPYEFNGDSVLSFTASDTVVGDYSIEAVNLSNAEIRGESGLITVQALPADRFTILSSQSAITVGTERLLQTALEDQYGNRIAGSTVTFTRIHGGGVFSDNGSATIDKTTGSNGVAEALYTASENISFVNDSIRVTSGGIADTIVLPLNAAPVSYYTFIPSGDFTADAGEVTNFTLTARDQYGNGVTNNGTVSLNAKGSSSAQFSAGPYTFDGDSVLSFTVSDTVAGDFTVEAVNQNNAEIRGESGLITVQALPADRFTILSSQSAITVGTERLLQTALEDQYGNRIAGSTVTFTRIHGGGVFSDNGSATIDKTTGSNGVAEALYTASENISFVNDSIRVTSGGIADTIVLPLNAAPVSYYTFIPSGDFTADAGEVTNFTLTARDQYGNGVTNNGTVSLNAKGSSSAQFSAGPYTFDGDSVLGFTVSDTVAGDFTVRAVNQSNADISGESGLITVNPQALNYVIIRSEAKNGGSEVGDLSLTTDDAYTFYAAGYDIYNNYIDDVTVDWTTTGTLESVTLAGTSKFTFYPSVAGGSGTVRADHATATDDETGTITVATGNLAEIRIQKTDSADGPVLNDTTITADETLTVYSVGYDADGNYLGVGSTPANWTLSGLSGSLAPANPTTSVTFTPELKSNGSIRAEANSNPNIYDRSGSITVNAGGPDYLLIRTEPNGGGQEIGDVSLDLGETLNLYAAAYDSKNNFSRNAAVDWKTTGSISGLGDSLDTYVTTLSPTSPGSGAVYTTNGNGWTNDTTGTITAQSGELDRIEIRTAANGAGVPLQDSTANAGNNWTLYAAGYDRYDNYLQDVAVTWQITGDSIGYFSTAGSTAVNTINFTTKNTNSIRIDRTEGDKSFYDYSGSIKVNAGPADIITRASSDTVSGKAGEFVADPLKVKVTDAFDNPIANVLIEWKTNTDGSFNPVSSQTDALGFAESDWKLKTEVGLDSSWAVANVIPDSVKFFARVLESTADKLQRYALSDSARTDTVAQQLEEQLIVEVVDSLGNAVPDVNIRFGVIDYPAAGDDYSFVPQPTGVTDANGRVGVDFISGSKTGLYTITAYNEDLLNSGSVFFSVTAVAGAADRLNIVSGNALQDTVGKVLVDSPKVRVVDAYENAVSGVTVNWQATATGSADPFASVSNSSGIAATEWTLRQQAGADTLIASGSGLTPVNFTAQAINDAPFAVVADSGNYRTSVADGGQVLRVRLEDQYANIISGKNVNFSALASGAYLSDYIDRTDNQGLAQTVYNSPGDQDTTYVRAFIQNVDTTLFELYHIQYLENSLRPNIVALNDTVSFYVQITNPGPDDITLDQANTIFSFAEKKYTAVLDSPATISGETATLKFESKVVDGDITGGVYTPKVDFAGSGAYDNLNGRIRTADGELNVEPVQILSVFVPDPKTVRRGSQKERIRMKVKNVGSYVIGVDSAALTFSPDYGFDQTQTSGPDSLLPGVESTFEFTVVVPETTPVDTITVDGLIICTCSQTGSNLQDGSADQTDIMVVTQAAELTFVDYTPDIVSENQGVAFTVSIQNDGPFDVVLNSDSTTLEFGGQNFYLTNNQALEAQATTGLSFAESVLTLTSGQYPGTLSLKGTENGADFDTTMTLSDDLTVQTAASLQLSAVVLSDTVVRRGQSGDVLKAAVINNGEATARIISRDSVILDYNAEYTLTPQQTYPFDIAGGANDTLSFAIKVASDAPLGPDTFRVEIGYQDINSETNYHESNPAIYDHWRILGSGALRVLSVQTDFDAVSTGQQNVPVVVRLRNDGQQAVQLDSVRLNMSKGSYDPQSLFQATDKRLDPAESDTVNFLVDVNATPVVTGLASLNATGYATDTYDGHLLTDAGADTTDSWLIQEQVTIEIVDNWPGTISSGQYMEPTVTVNNTGDATLNIDTSRSRLQSSDNPAFSRQLISPLTIRGNSENVALNFKGKETIFDPGTYALELVLVGTENDYPYNDEETGQPAPNSLVIQSTASIRIDSVIAEAEMISQGADTTISVVVSNTGEADLLLDSLIIEPYGLPSAVAPKLTTVIAGLAQSRFSLDFSLPEDAALGVQTLDARAVGRDQNYVNANFDSTLTDDGADVTDSWEVFTPADVTVSSITSTYSVVNRGQQDIPVSVTLQNNGQAPAVVTNLVLNEQIGLYNHSYPAFGFTIAGQGDTTVTVLTDVLANSSTGNDTIYATVSYDDAYSNFSGSSESTEYLAWMINTGESAVDIVSVSTEPANVSRGQENIAVQVRVRNESDAEVVIDDLTLVFRTNDSTAYTQGAITPPLGILQAGIEAIYTVPVTVGNNALTGPDTVSARLDVTESVSGLSYSVNDPAVYDSWIVQLRPDIVIDSVSVQPSVASTGQNDLRATAYVTNTAAPNRADAQIDSVQINLTLNGENKNDSFSITRQNTPSLPLILQTGKSGRFEFDLDVRDTTGSGNYLATARIVGRDVNDGRDTVVTATQNPDTLTIETSASIEILSVWINPDTVSEGQDHARVYVDYRNNGQAPAEITRAELDFGQPALSFTEVLLNRTTPYMLDGVLRDTLIYSMIIPQISADTLTVNVHAQISGLDNNSDKKISGSSGQPGTFLIQSPADIKWVETNPASWSDTTAFQFRIKVENLGQAMVDLNRDQTNLDILPLDGSEPLYSVPLAAESPVVLGTYPDTTELIFEETTLPIPEGEYNLMLNLNGMTNDSVYASEVNAGQFAYGEGIISITSVQIQGSDQVVQGQDSIIVVMKVSNTGEPISITDDLTKLIFTGPGKSGDRDAFVLNLTRLDTLTLLKKESNNQLKFRFDLDNNFPTENETEIYGQIGLDNGNIVKVSNVFDQMFVLTSGNAILVSGTIAPDTVVAGQNVTFTAAFRDSGTADVVLNADETYLEILNSGIDPIYASGKFTVAGLDTTTITYRSRSLPNDFNSGLYDVRWVVKGELINGESYQNEGIASGALRVISGARLIFSQIDIGPQKVRQGQTDIPINFTVRNSGQSEANLTGVSYLFRTDTENVSGNWLVASGGIDDTTISGGQSVSWPVNFNLSSKATTGMVNALPKVTFNDMRRPTVSIQSDSITAGDSVLVITPARIRLDSLIIVKDAQAPNAPYVNIDSTFNLRVQVSNLGADSIKNAVIRLYRGNELQPGSVIFSNIPPDTNQSALIEAEAQFVGQNIYKALIESATDLTDAAIAIEQPLDNLETVIVQQPTQLWLSAAITAPPGATDSVVSIDQSFTLQAKVNRAGSSPFGEGWLRLDLPSNFQFVQSGDDGFRRFNMDTLIVSWQIMPTALTNGQLSDTLQIYMQDVPIDSNIMKTVKTEPEARFARMPVRVENAGMIQSIVSITAPAGAQDRVVSTGQEFTVRGNINFNGPVAPTERTARILLPDGFSVKDSSTMSLTDGVESDSVFWRVIAPTVPDSDEDTLFIEVTARDANSGDLIKTVSDGFLIDVLKRSHIVMNTEPVEPEGASDRTVSTYQEVVLRTSIGNLGEAGFDDSGIIRMSAGNGILFKRNRNTGEENTPQNVISGFSAQSYRDTLLMPADGGMGNVIITIAENELPGDVNSGLPVLIRRDSVNVQFQIVERTELVLRFDHAGTVSDTLIRAAGQSFKIKALLNNNGTAAVNESGYVILDTLGSGLIFSEDDSLRRRLKPGEFTTWDVSAPDYELEGTLRVRADAQAAGYLDENALTWAFVQDTAQADTIALSIKDIESIEIASRYVINQVQIADSLTVSTEQDSILISADVLFDPTLDSDRSARLILPEGKGFASLDSTLIRTLDEQNNPDIKWYLRAPNRPQDWSAFTIVARAKSATIPGLPEQVISQKLHVKAVTKANLALRLDIVEPSGATDDTLAYGQMFKLRGIVENLSVNGAEAVGKGLARIETGDMFTLIDTLGFSDDMTRSFNADTAFYWWLKVNAAQSKALSETFASGANPAGGESMGSTKKTDGETFTSIKQLMQAATSASAANAAFSVVLDELPMDENTFEAAAVQNESVQKQIYLTEAASIEVAASEAPQTLSTGQTFQYSLSANLISDLINPVALIETSVGLGGNTVNIPLDQNNEAQLQMSVPAQYSGTGADTIRAMLYGTDANSGKTVTAAAVDEEIVTIQKKARLSLTNPRLLPDFVNRSKEISRGQGIEVRVKPDSSAKTGPLPYAAITGIGRVALDSSIKSLGFTLDGGGSWEKSFTGYGQTLSWKIKAPRDTNVTVSLNLKFTQLPLDENIGEQADIAADSGIVGIPVRVRQKTVEVNVLNNLITQKQFSKGDQNRPLLAFRISNANYDESLKVKGVNLEFFTSTGALIEENKLNSKSLVSMLNTLSVVDYSEAASLLAKPKSVRSVDAYIDYQFTDTTDNPLWLNFSETAVIPAGDIDTMVIIAEFQDNAVNRGFRTVLRNIFAYDYDENTALDIIDSSGVNITQSGAFESEPLTIVSEDPEDAFYNYPNPFGRQYPSTWIKFRLENPSDVQIRIFTLLGELVWSWEGSDLPGGLYENLVRWDGKNDRGNIVLNGVYLGTIDIKPQNGQSAKRYITKIAFIK